MIFKKNRVGRPELSDFKPYYKATVMINFKCESDWATWWTEVWPNIILDVFVSFSGWNLQLNLCWLKHIAWTNVMVSLSPSVGKDKKAE